MPLALFFIYKQNWLLAFRFCFLIGMDAPVRPCNGMPSQREGRQGTPSASQ